MATKKKRPYVTYKKSSAALRFSGGSSACAKAPVKDQR